MVPDTQGQNVPGTPPASTGHSDSGNSGNSTQRNDSENGGTPGAVDSVPQAGPGAPQPYQ